MKRNSFSIVSLALICILLNNCKTLKDRITSYNVCYTKLLRMLVGLGFNPLYAAGICLIANTAPVAFGSIGIPIIVASKVSGIPEIILSQMVGRTLPLISLIIPFYLVFIT